MHTSTALRLCAFVSFALTLSTAALGQSSPGITTQPTSQTAIVGSNVVFSVVATGQTPLTYEWDKNTVPLSDNSHIKGSTNSSMTISSVVAADAASYRVVVSNRHGVINSSNATLTVLIPPSITQQPASTTIGVGSNAVFSATTTGTAPTTNRWLFNGTPLIDNGRVQGSTSTTLTIANVTAADAGTYTLAVSNVAGSATSSQASLTVAFPPAFISQPQNVSVGIGTNAVLTFEISGTQPVTNAWLFNGAPVTTNARVSVSTLLTPSATTITKLTINSADVGDAGSYTVVSSNVVGSATSSVETLTVAVVPAISTQPQNQSVLVGSNAVFSISATANVPLSYQWSFNGVSLDGETNTSLTILTAQGWQTGQYTAVVSDIAGSTTSDAATLSVNTQPVALININFGDSTYPPPPKAGLAAIGVGTNDLWNFYDRNNLPYSPYRTFGTLYDVYFSDRRLSPVRMDVTNAPAVFTFGTLDPMYESFLYSTTSDPLEVTFHNIASGTFDFYIYGHQPDSTSSSTYELQIDGVSYGQLSTAASPQWSSTNWIEGTQFVAFRGVQIPPGSSLVKIIVTGNTSEAPNRNIYPHGVLAGIQIAQMPATPVPPTFWMQPHGGTVKAGVNAYFAALVTGSQPLTYQWTFNGAPLSDGGIVSGATSPALTISNTTTFYQGTYDLVVSNVAGSVTSLDAVLAISVTPPSVDVQPTNTTVLAGQNAVFTTSVSGSPTLTNQWYFNGTPLADGGNIIGATTSSLTVSNAQANDAGSYYLMVSNEAGTTNSDVATLTVGFPPVITQQPPSQTNNQGSTVLFHVDVTGSQPLSIQWFLNGAALTDDSRHSGTTNTTLSIYTISASDAGTYSVTVSNAYGVVISSNATLTVLTPPSITTQPIGRSVPTGLPTVFTANASGSAPLTFQWQFGGVDIANATTTSLTISSVSDASVGSYTLIASNALGTATSGNAVLSIGPVAGWGLNANNQCLPPPGLSNVVAISGSQSTSFALLADGSVVEWGSNVALPTGLSNIVALSTFPYLSIGAALRSDGTAVGINRSVPNSFTNLIAVACDPNITYGVRADGTVISSAQQLLPGLNHMTSIACSVTYVSALRDDGTVVSWSPSAGIAVPVPLAATNVVSIASGYNCTFAVKGDGTILGWGTNNLLAIPAAATNVVSMAVSGSPALTTGIAVALRRDGTVVSWGITQTPTNIIAPSMISNAVAVAVGISHGLALINDGSPQILRPPIGGTTYTGRDYTFRVMAAGTQLSYQWSYNGAPIADATNSALVLSNLQTNNAGSYQVSVSNALGSVTSVPAPLKIMNGGPWLYNNQIVGAPPIVTAFIGAKADLGFPINGSLPMKIQWRFHPTNNINSFTNISGATNELLTLDPVYPTNGGYYSVVASNAFGTLTSRTIQLLPQQVVVWGDNTYSKTNVPSSLTNAIAVCGGNLGNCFALTDDGSIVEWGGSGKGAVMPGFTNMIEVGTSYTSANSPVIALRTNGTLFSTAFTTVYTNALATLSNIIALEVDSGGSTFLKPDGSIVRVTSNGTNTSLGVSNVVALSQWDDGFQALRADGTVFGYGGGGGMPLVTNVAAVASSRYVGTFLRRDQTIVDWGHAFPTNTPTNGYLAIASSSLGTELGLRTDGGLLTWGASSVASFIPGGLPRLRVVDGGYNNFIALCTAEKFDPVLLHTALNTTNLVVSSRNAAQWYAQHDVTHDGVSAARSATIGRNTATSMRTLVTGPAQIGFWWKVSSETNHDFLSFSIGGVQQAAISGEADWQRVVFNVPAGPQMLVWTYSKDGSGTAGQDAAWVDEFSVGPQPPYIYQQPQSQTVLGGSTVQFFVGATGQAPLTYFWFRNSDPTGGSKSPGTNLLTFLNVHRSLSATFKCVVSNSLGTVTSSNAVLVVHTPQEIATPQLQPDGTFLITSGDSDGAFINSQTSLANFKAQYSSNLLDWLPINSSLSLSNGQIIFIDTEATNSPQRFYRILENW
jgi:hypothetical protein